MDAFKAVAARLDLETAVRQGSTRNDLLPPRPDDKVGGQVGRRLSAALKSELERGRYRPDEATFIFVPKGMFATRPAALMSLADRTVYAALVESLRERIEKALQGESIVMWPRGVSTSTHWKEFERAPLAHGSSHIVRADISGFYESIPHEALRDVLLRTTGRAEEVAALIEFLGAVMGAARGIPQGYDGSDPLATAYLSSIDAEMVRHDLNYVRHGDDIRIGATDFPKARRALFLLERAVRRAGLLLNGTKSTIVRRATYEKALTATEQAIDSTRQRLRELKREQLLEDEDKLAEVMKEADREQLAWDFFYHHSVDLDEVIAALANELEPDDIVVAETLFAETIARAPGKKRPLPSDVFHQRITTALTRLAAGKSLAALSEVPEVMTTFPDKSDVVFSYLNSIAAKDPQAVIRTVEEVIHGPEFKTEWERAWQLRALSTNPGLLQPATAQLIATLATDEETPWIVRVESMKVLALRNELQADLPRKAWELAPAAHRADVIDAVARIRPTPPWAEAFLSAAKEDPVCAVVIEHASSTSTPAGNGESA
jgi:hypothetical protein